MVKNNQKPQQRKNSSLIPEKKKGSSFFILLAFCLPVLVYLQTLSFGFTYFDDDGIIINHIGFLSNFRNVPQAFVSNQFVGMLGSFYRPMGTLSYMLDIQLSGGSHAWMYHLSNILILGGISCILFLLLKRFSIPPKLALLSTLIYCVHPLFASTTAFLPNRAELLQTFFALLSFLLLIDFLQKKKFIYLLFHWISFTIALFSKETAAFLPFLFILYYFIFYYKKPFEIKHLFIIILYAVSGLFWLWLRSKAVGNYTDPESIFGLKPLLINLRIIPESLSKFFLPFDMAPIPAFSILKALIGLGIMALIVIVFIRNKERPSKEKVFCFAWFLILMLPPLLYKNPYIDYLDHRFFLPSIGILLFLLFIFPKKWLLKGDIKRPWLMIAVIVFLSSFTIIKSRPYSDSVTFYNTAIAKNPKSVIAYYNRGTLRINKNDYQGAMDDYDKVIELYPTHEMAYLNRGNLKRSKNDFKGAMDDFNKVLAINPNNAEAYNNKGSLIGLTGNFKEALINFNKAIEINPKFTNAYENIAVADYYLKDFKGALEACEKTLNLNPNDEMALKIKTQIQKEEKK